MGSVRELCVYFFSDKILLSICVMPIFVKCIEDSTIIMKITGESTSHSVYNITISRMHILKV